MMIAEGSRQFCLSSDTFRDYERIERIPPIHKNGICDDQEEALQWM
ncbi:MerR family transcriptional regulator [Beduini massiliensis]|nr:hypothetical protein [Beduini massiliensis]